MSSVMDHSRGLMGRVLRLLVRICVMALMVLNYAMDLVRLGGLW